MNHGKESWGIQFSLGGYWLQLRICKGCSKRETEKRSDNKGTFGIDTGERECNAGNPVESKTKTKQGENNEIISIPKEELLDILRDNFRLRNTKFYEKGK